MGINVDKLSNTQQSKVRITYLDGLRGVAAMVVVVFHIILAFPRIVISAGISMVK